MFADIFHTTLGALFVLDALVRLKNLQAKKPIPETTPKMYRINLHVNMAIGLCLIGLVLLGSLST